MELAHLVAPGNALELGRIAADEKGPFSGKDDADGLQQLERALAKTSRLQERLYAEKTRALLVVLQAMDTGGKDGVLRRVVGPLDSRGVRVASFKAPDSGELAHDYLWRVHQQAPARGEIVFFNRSHYEDVLVTRVLGLVPKSAWKRRFDHINAFERILTDEGTRVVKIFLHISKEEQKRRLEERLADPEKHWKFDPADVSMRRRWDDFMLAYEDALSRTSTEHAPWYVVPADRKWYRDLAVAKLLAKVLDEMDPRVPAPKADLKDVVIPD